MGRLSHVGDLEIEHDMDSERRSWTIERIGWGVLALLIVLALVGVFGNGPISRATAGDAGSDLWVEYPRFMRFGSPAELRVHLKPAGPAGGDLRLWMDREYLQRGRGEHVTPEPLRVEAAGDRLIYVFPNPAADQSTIIAFSLDPGHFGSLQGRAGLEGGSSVSFRSFTYP